MFLVFKNLINSFLDLIYKQKCLICSCAKTNELLCKTCAKDVHYLSGFPQAFYNEIPIYCATIYENVIKELIHQLKFSHKKNSAKVLAQLLFNYYQKLDFNNSEFIITYPKSYISKSFERGYNHMSLIAKEFSKLTGYKIEHNLIKKIKYTKPQYQAKNRYSNIKNSFQIDENILEKYKNKQILFIDDITTSGATVEEILNCFCNLNFKNITCLIISKTKK